MIDGFARRRQAIEPTWGSLWDSGGRLHGGGLWLSYDARFIGRAESEGGGGSTRRSWTLPIECGVPTPHAEWWGPGRPWWPALERRKAGSHGPIDTGPPSVSETIISLRRSISTPVTALDERLAQAAKAEGLQVLEA